MVEPLLKWLRPISRVIKTLSYLVRIIFKFKFLLNLVLDNLQVERLKRADNDSTKQLLVATHYYNPDDEREIKGFKDPAKELERHIEELQM